LHACVRIILPRKSAPPIDGIPPLGDDNADSILWAPSVMGSTSAQNPYSVAGIFPS